MARGENALISIIMPVYNEGEAVLIMDADLLQLFIGSMLMISLGIIGMYLMKIYHEIKGRPRYLVSKTVKNGVEEC